MHMVHWVMMHCLLWTSYEFMSTKASAWPCRVLHPPLVWWSPWPHVYLITRHWSDLHSIYLQAGKSRNCALVSVKIWSVCSNTFEEWWRICFPELNCDEKYLSSGRRLFRGWSVPVSALRIVGRNWFQSPQMNNYYLGHRLWYENLPLCLQLRRVKCNCYITIPSTPGYYLRMGVPPFIKKNKFCLTSLKRILPLSPCDKNWILWLFSQFPNALLVL